MLVPEGCIVSGDSQCSRFVVTEYLSEQGEIILCAGAAYYQRSNFLSVIGAFMM